MILFLYFHKTSTLLLSNDFVYFFQTVILILYYLLIFIVLYISNNDDNIFYYDNSKIILRMKDNGCKLFMMNDKFKLCKMNFEISFLFQLYILLVFLLSNI